MAKPILVLVGGPGGAGKTTLGRAVADRMGLVHLSRDAVKSAIAASNASIGPDGSPAFDEAKATMGAEYGQRAFATAYAAVASLLDGGASVVMDQAWRRGRSENELLPLLQRSRALLLMADTAPKIAAQRAHGRGTRSGLAPRGEALASGASDWATFTGFDLGVPRLVVDTTDDYDPSLPEIERWVWQNMREPN